MNRIVRRWAGTLAGAIGISLIVGCSGSQIAKTSGVAIQPPGVSSERNGEFVLVPPSTVHLVANKAAAPSAVPPPPPSDETAPDDQFYDPFANPDETAGGEEYDPWEPFNTKVFEFNRQLDRWVLKPVAQAYNFVVPNIVQRGVSNFFYNTRFPPRLFNNLFQGKWVGAGKEVGRFLVNTTIGVAGFVDVASSMNLTTPEEDLGQTLGYYGVKPGPYLVLPFLPPYTVRDFVGYLGDIALNPIYWLVLPIIEVEGIPSAIAHHNRTTTTFVLLGTRVGEVVNDRSLNLENFQGVEEATLDLYVAVRNFYLQKRAKVIRD